MQLLMTLLILGVWIWIGTYGFLASKRKNQKFITLAWALLIVIVAAYILSTLFV